MLDTPISFLLNQLIVLAHNPNIYTTLNVHRSQVLKLVYIFKQHVKDINSFDIIEMGVSNLDG